LPYIIVAAVFGHLAALHMAGSNNPTGAENTSTVTFAPHFVVKDIFVFFIVFFLLANVVY
jgi:ubiquinol-cytochrome c reductase cytochrome b subunit